MEEPPTPTGRTRREKRDRTGRKSALERFKQLKGTKHKYEVDDVDNVWEDVDEKEYSKRVQDRLEDDWIEDDGTGYVEDGREVFDEDVEDPAPKRSKKGTEPKKKMVRDIAPPPKSSNIKSMFQSMPTKKKPENDVKLDKDVLLNELLMELGTPSPKPHVTPKQVRRTPQPSSSRSTPSSSIPLRMPLKKKPMPNRNQSNLVSTAPRRTENVKEDMSSEWNEAPDQDAVCDFSDEIALVKVKEEIIEPKIEPEDTLFDDIPDEFFTEVNENDFKNWAEQEVKESPQAQNSTLTKLVQSKPKSALTNMDMSQVMAFDINGTANGESPVTSSGTVNLNLPLDEDNDNEKVLNFFWLDAFEDPFKQPGVVYLFGKVWVESTKSYASCCLVVKNIDRTVFVLPREKKINLQTRKETDHCVDMNDVYTEIGDVIAERFKISEFKSKRTTKNYVFGAKGVPIESEYLELKYSATCPALPSNLEGETFSHVFGTSSSALELLLLNRSIKGPCWLRIKKPESVNAQISWCKLEAVINKMELIEVVQNCKKPSPPVSVLSLWTQMATNSKVHQTEIVAMVGLYHEQYPLHAAAPKNLHQSQFCILTKPSDGIFPFDFKDKVHQMKQKIDIVENERALMSLMLTRIFKLDPDIIIGYDIAGYDLDVMLQRMNVRKVQNWSRLGRLRRSVFPSSGGVMLKSSIMTCGRVLCDIKLSAKEFIQSKSYDFGTLSEKILKQPHALVEQEEVKDAYKDSQTLLCLVIHLYKTSLAVLQMFVELNVLPLTSQMTSIAGNLLSRTMLGGRSERNEYLLLHAFSERNFIVPDKQYRKNGKVEQEDLEGEHENKKTAGRKKPAYSGGLVLAPKKGFYDKYVLLMDFNSLYPSIIQEYNLCFTTVPQFDIEEIQGDQPNFPLPDKKLVEGVLPVQIKKLVDSRRSVKQLLKTPNLSADDKLRYEIRQKALKLMANSMYGCLGFTNSRFYAKHLAAMVTALGRQILMKTKELVEGMSIEVLYGDTDSLMINTACLDYSEVMRLGTKIKLAVNKLYRCLEIDIDGVFRSVLLLKKKKYAALKSSFNSSNKEEFSAEIKGLDIIRRDWSELACETGKFVIDEILSTKPRDGIIENIVQKLEKTAADMSDNRISLEKLAITKQLTKNPEDYADKKSLAHVAVALRLNSKGGKKLRQGDTVRYVICQDGSTLSATQRAYHLDEMEANSNLVIDKNYYLAHQIHPVVSRICDPIDELDAARIADCLGLDGANYRSTNAATRNNGQEGAADEGVDVESSEKDKYRDCDLLTFKCPGCQDPFIFNGIFTGKAPELESGFKCSTPSCTATEAVLCHNVLTTLKTHITSQIKRLSMGWMVCDNVNCGFRMNAISNFVFDNGKGKCYECNFGKLRPEYMEQQLYRQLCYFEHLFDLGKATSGDDQSTPGHFPKLSPLVRNTIDQSHSMAANYLANNAYGRVQLTRFFGPLIRNSPKSTS